MPEDKVASLITAAAHHRLQKKTRRLATIADIHGPDEALYQAIAEALGYRYNKLPMQVLAQRLPLQSLLHLKPIDREAQLFGAAGFIDLDHFTEGKDPQTRLYLKNLWGNWWKNRDQLEANEERLLNWNLTGIRPLNHPQRRLGALASITNTWSRLRKILQHPEQDPKLRVIKLKEFFSSLEHPYWNHHYTLRSKPADTSTALVGRDRLQDILGNVIFPWLMIDNPDYWDQYTQLPGSQVNEKNRRASLRLFGKPDKTNPQAGKWAGKFYGQQALLQIYTDFCLEDSTECETCPFPEQLSQW